MSESKDKRIKKLKRKRIWPSIVGLFVITSIFAIMLLALIGSNIEDVVKRKVLNGLVQAERIAESFEDYQGENNQNTSDSILNYIDMSLETEAVWVSNLEGEKIWANSEMSPNVEKMQKLEFGDSKYLNLIIEDDSEKILSANVIGKHIINGDNIIDILDSNYSNNEKIAVIKVWYVQEIDDLKVYVLQDINVYSYDCFMMLVSVGLFGIMIAIFILYYLVSFISVIINIRRTSKVIYTDMTTGGKNWLYFVKKGNRILKSKISLNNYAVIHLKMRKYRSFCTCFGVKEGEVLVEKMYHVLKKHVKRSEVMVFKENATFALMLTYENEEQLRERIEVITNNLNMLISNMKLYFAVGIYKVNKKETDVEQLYNNAVLACDMSGEEAETQIIFYDIEMNNRRIWERKVENDMYSALANHEFKVYLQPKISTSNEHLAGAEALVRWIHPREGFIPPNKFIPIFERNGFILKLDDYMLEEIAKQQSEWIKLGRKVVPISVNISRAHFAKEDLAEHICGIVDKYQVPHDVIELELTESAFFDDKQVLLDTVRKLRDAGFIVSMDDFGAGYSSLNSLKEMQLDVLKIDADFFRGAEAQERGLLIVSEVIDLAKKLNMKIVAEGIESREQVEFLTEQECDLIQGYFYSKPMPISEFEVKYGENQRL
ncbi:MAG: EAL domain-containing protein [Lachnospiraceae bacterium]|nr:EAL domain-containing protein [Lachnospiraceae bacterium]